MSKKEKRRIIDEFKEFINRGIVVDLSFAFVMGAAFKWVIVAFDGSTVDACDLSTCPVLTAKLSFKSLIICSFMLSLFTRLSM